MYGNLTRRRFIQGSSLLGLAAAVGTSPRLFAQAALRQRLDWNTFKAGRDYASFMDAVKKMRANTNAADKRSWAYWSNIHFNNCPHGIPYFLAWHRGYLGLFEQQLREVSGNPALALPYWDYYRDPAIPAEFLNPASWNPLYNDRVNSDVTQALTLNPFSNTLVNFQRGASNAFEPSLEFRPHNPVHDLIGSTMTTMQSPTDPIFWLHHANIDRLWNAWVLAANGRSMPVLTDPYWSGTLSYSARLTLARSATFSTRANWGYFYENETFPTALPAAPAALMAAAKSPERLPGRPADGRFASSGMRPTQTGQLALAGALDIALTLVSITARVKLERAAVDKLQSVLAQYQAPPRTLPPAPSPPYSTVTIVLDDVRMTDAGANGGYFYNLYLNLPDDPPGIEFERQYLITNLGPFFLVASGHHAHAGKGSRLEFDATEQLLADRQRDLSEHTFSFVRISGNNSPDGAAITVGEFRLELSGGKRP